MPELHQAGIEGRAHPGQQLEREVLTALLHAGHRALAGVQGVSQLDLGPAPVLPGVADEHAEASQIGVFVHGPTVSQI